MTLEKIKRSCYSNIGDAMNNSIEAYQQAHRENYYHAIRELIHKNTEAFIYDDLFSLFEKPPLDSMDVIKNELLSLAKANQLLLKTEVVTEQTELFWKTMKKQLQKIGKERETCLLDKLKPFCKEETDTIRILKKDLVDLDKRLKKNLETALKETGKQILFENLPTFFEKKDAKLPTASIQKAVLLFCEKKYPKYILEKFDVKILVKDTTLLNVLKEQTERYLFTKENSHLFD